MARRQRPNLFELEGAGQTSIVYSTTSLAGSPQLTYKEGDNETSFSGDEIRSSRNALFGTLVSVELANRPDQDTVFLVLVLPTVNLGENGTVKIRTFAVLTTHRTSIGGPDLVDGALQTYKTVSLRGNASQVDFLR
jgi:hypothetical protein